jgi:hypothetical protein
MSLFLCLLFIAGCRAAYTVYSNWQTTTVDADVSIDANDCNPYDELFEEPLDFGGEE